MPQIEHTFEKKNLFKNCIPVPDEVKEQSSFATRSQQHTDTQGLVRNQISNKQSSLHNQTTTMSKSKMQVVSQSSSGADNVTKNRSTNLQTASNTKLGSDTCSDL